nr:immunoglobulin light chain junction region [Macaca mulatta]MPN94321.1 immunoglobulin light chain junction region [Macaca mulatta]MPN96491.1 immunoglobulin light chain junction region [Macaca mulatta]
CRQGYSAPYSF